MKRSVLMKLTACCMTGAMVLGSTGVVTMASGLDSALAYKRHFPAINWLNSYSLYLDNMKDWFNETVAPDWMDDRQRMMSLLTEEAALEEIVQMVGMDALSPSEDGSSKIYP